MTCEDRWVTKVEYAPGDRKLAHHILSYIDTTSAAEALDRADPGPGYTCFGGPGFAPDGGLSGWAPGIQPRVMADGVGMLLPKGANVVLQMHYNNHAPESRTDRTRVASRPPRPVSWGEGTTDEMASTSVGDPGEVMHRPSRSC